MKLHHIGIVVADLDEGLRLLDLQKSDIVETVYDPNQQNKLHFVYLEENDLWLELVEPTSPTSSTANFAEKHELGLHHIGKATDDIDATEALYAQRSGSFVLGRYKIEVDSFGGRIRTLFIALKGLLLEFVDSDEEPPSRRPQKPYLE